MARIMEVLGLPPSELLELSSRKNMFFDGDGDPFMIPNSKGKIRYPGTTPLHTRIGPHDKSLLDFLQLVLQWDPEKRITPEEALNHPWILEANKNYPTPRSSVHKRKARSFLSADFHINII